MNPIRVLTIAKNSFQEVIRDRILYFIGFFALLLILAQKIIPEIAAGTDEKILLDFGIGAIAILTVIIAIFVGTALINKEIEKRTLLMLIPKPISRAELIVGKHLGLLAVLVITISIMMALYLGMLQASGISYPTLALIISAVYLLIELALLIAVAMVFGVFTSSILATLLSFGVYLMGHFSQDLVELGKLSKNSSIESLTTGLYLVLPDLSRLDLKNEAVYGLLPSGGDLLAHALYGIIYTILLLIVAITVFSQKEF
ncbi:ABC-type transport system involved in multi-copper enzyme maturation, permease component [Xenococcus sp. PCC 7305]|uniref:ABC transporter permease n=1 Tax=Xenococcus sp. PCC 7305 TaxID=102125 RepID=UPI0002AC72E7|nr:ABC transporter permease subunit [Xenococcus sp. PCC 7305]ELS03386.1 ABC-type transport system involved in multi-copper enzyme maturation, permease component [Xenococcus sp. PCC 7305]